MNTLDKTVSPQLALRLQRVGRAILDEATADRRTRPAMTPTARTRRLRLGPGIVGGIVVALVGGAVGTLTFGAASPRDPIVGLVPASFQPSSANEIQSANFAIRGSAFTLVSSRGVDVLVQEQQSHGPVPPGIETVTLDHVPVVLGGVSGLGDKPAPFIWTWQRERGRSTITFSITTNLARRDAQPLAERIVQSSRGGTIQATASGLEVVGSWRSDEWRFFWIGRQDSGGFPSQLFDAPPKLRTRALNVYQGGLRQFAYADGFAYQRIFPGAETVRPIRASEARSLAAGYDRELAKAIPPAGWMKLSTDIELGRVNEQTLCARQRGAVACDRSGLFSRLLNGEWLIARCKKGGLAAIKADASGELDSPSGNVVRVAFKDNDTCWLVDPPIPARTFDVGDNVVVRPLF